MGTGILAPKPVPLLVLSRGLTGASCVMICVLEITRGGPRQGVETMSKTQNFSRRQFVSSAASAAAISCLQPGRELFAALAAPKSGTREFVQHSQVALTATPPWRDQGILNLTKPPYPKLRNVPFHPVTLQNAFWAQRPEVNVNTTIP